MPADPAEAWRTYRHERAQAMQVRRQMRMRPSDLDSDSAQQTLALQRSKVLAMRNELVERHLMSLSYAAQRLKLTLPKYVELDDLLLSGTPALIHLVERFRPAKGNKFETFAAPRLRGAILDALRQMDQVPRLARKRNQLRTQAIQDFLKAHGRPPNDEETRQALTTIEDEAERARVLSEKPIPSSVSIDSPVQAGRRSDPQTLGEMIPGTSGNPLTEAQRQDLKRFITQRLPRRERLMVLLYYFEAMTMSEVATVLGISESRVSQCLKDLHGQLRARLETRENELEG